MSTIHPIALEKQHYSQASPVQAVALPAALERHYTVGEVAELWNLSETKVREMFIDEPGVLQTQLRTLRARKRQNVSLRIPESIMLRVHARWAVSGRI
jgi:hypothetical protein